MNPANDSSKKHATEAGKMAALDAGRNDAAGPEGPGNVDKIRDILFGTQMRDYDKRFARFEERLLKETADLREEVKRRFASLETFVKGEVAALHDGLKAEKADRVEALKELARELKDSTKGWEKKAGQIEEQSTKAQRDLRQQILEETQRLTEEMERHHQDAARRLDKESEELRATLTDRLALADLFSEVALRLKNEFELPDKK